MWTFDDLSNVLNLFHLYELKCSFGKIALNGPKSPKITQNHPKSLKIAQNHPNDPKLFQKYPILSNIYIMGNLGQLSSIFENFGQFWDI